MFIFYILKCLSGFRNKFKFNISRVLKVTLSSKETSITFIVEVMILIDRWQHSPYINRNPIKVICERMCNAVFYSKLPQYIVFCINHSITQCNYNIAIISPRLLLNVKLVMKTYQNEQVITRNIGRIQGHNRFYVWRLCEYWHLFVIAEMIVCIITQACNSYVHTHQNSAYKYMLLKTCQKRSIQGYFEGSVRKYVECLSK